MKETLITSSVIIICVLVLRRVLRGRAGMGVICALWLLAAVRLMLPFSLAPSPVSVMNAVEAVRYGAAAPAISSAAPIPYDTPAAPITAAPVPSGDTGTAAPAPASDVPASGTAETAPRRAADPRAALKWAWLIGAAVTGGWFAYTNLSFARRLRRTRVQVECPECPLPVYTAEGLASPCLFGLFRPAVYLTPESAGSGAVLRHELTHYRHGDHIWSTLRGVITALYWFDPLVWAMAVLSRQDQELFCDETVIASLTDAERLDYGRTLVSMVARRTRPGDVLTAATTMTGSKKSIKERVTFIARKPKKLIWAVTAAVLAAAVLAGCTFTGAGKKSDRSTMTSRYISTSGLDSQGVALTFDLKNDVNGVRIDSYLYENGRIKSDAWFTCGTGGLEDLSLSYLWSRGESGYSSSVELYAKTGDIVKSCETSLPEDIIGRSFSCLDKSEKPIEIEPEKAYVVMVATYDKGDGIESVGCNELTDDPTLVEKQYAIGYVTVTFYTEAAADTDFADSVSQAEQAFPDGSSGDTDTRPADGTAIVPAPESANLVDDAPPEKAARYPDYLTPLQGTPVGDVMEYDSGDYTLDIPMAINDEVFVCGMEGSDQIFTVYEKQSLFDCYEENGWPAGYLFGIVVDDRADYEFNLSSDMSGLTYFATDGTRYFGHTYATDVQFYRSGVQSYTPELFEPWNNVSSYIEGILDDFTERHGLTPFSEREFFAREFTYDGEHRYVEMDIPASSFGKIEMVLSQPVRQGEGGIWCVERWYDYNWGNEYIVFPSNEYQSELTSDAYYLAIQDSADKGGDGAACLTPMGAAEYFVENTYLKDFLDGYNGTLKLLDAVPGGSVYKKMTRLCADPHNVYFSLRSVTGGVYRETPPVLRMSEYPVSFSRLYGMLWQVVEAPAPFDSDFMYAVNEADGDYIAFYEKDGLV